MKFLRPNQFVQRLNIIFEEVKSEIVQALPHSEVEHIGSSAIRDAISKGDLDILVRVNLDRFEESVVTITSLGFKIKVGTLRTESLCMLVTNEYSEDVAIQLISRGSQFEDFIKFRDRLNSNPDLVDQYNKLKRESTGLTPEEYRARKSRFIEKILTD